MASFRELETDLDFGSDPWHGDAGPVPVRRYPPEEQSVLAREFLAAATTAQVIQRSLTTTGRGRSEPGRCPSTRSTACG
jgi:hypothetical protein